MTGASVLGHKVAYPTGVTILDAFYRQVQRNPDKVAVRYIDQELTYRDLNSMANAMALRLQASGIQRGNTVPVIIGNSLELPVSWLALIKLGAVFVPLDPEWPAKRIEISLEQLRAGAILTRKLDALSEVGTNVVEVNCEELDLSDQQLAIEKVSPDDRIYGFFTSGSTGQPKCALNNHRGIFNRFHYMTQHFRECQPKIVLLNSRHVFDPSVWQLLWTLTVGGEVLIPERAGHLNLLAMIDTVHKYSITMTDFVPSIFNSLTELIALDPALVNKLSSLQWLLIGGEAINVKAVNKFRRLLPHVRLTNTYGPTEASIGMVFHDVCDEDQIEIPLGLPIDNTFVAILDQQLEPLPQGDVGEIFIGGDCLGCGYLGDPEKTSQLFIPNPVSAIPGNTLYRTGDLGRIDGRRKLHFCGRLDTQTKINGIRIELGEIEHVLLRHKAVDEAVVIPIEQGILGRKKLCAFVVSKNSVAGDTLKNHLAMFLPQYMLPSHFVFCPSLPLTPNGKVDRQNLTVSLQTRLHEIPQKGGSISHTEEKLLKQFRCVLGNKHLSVDDNFFEHGGDSLSALETTLRTKLDTDIDIEVADIYAWPTVRELAGGARQRARDEAIPDMDWEQEFALADRLGVPRSTSPVVSETILVTGATGFVGAHILSTLLKSGSAKIVALVRNGRVDPFQRCRCTLARYGAWEEHFADRLTVVTGDLSEDNFGLNPTTWNELADTTHSIVHCGAMVDLLRTYSQHRPHNVIGTLEVLRLATNGVPKHVHYVSTLSVFDVPLGDGQSRVPMKESDAPEVGNLPVGGYQRSKSIAEGLVRKVQSNGLGATIYRLGEVGPSAHTGIANPKSFLNLLLTGCIRLGMYPDSLFYFDWTPVNSVANVIAYCINDHASDGETFHVMQRSSLSFGLVIEGLIEAGFRMRQVSYAEFWDSLEKRVRSPHVSDLTLLRAVLPRPSDSNLMPMTLVDVQRSYARDKFSQLLQRSTIPFPELDELELARIVAGQLQLRNRSAIAK